MKYREYCAISAALFAIVAIAHLLRVVLGLPINVDGVAVPMWISIVGVLIPAALAAWGFRIART